MGVGEKTILHRWRHIKMRANYEHGRKPDAFDMLWQFGSSYARILGFYSAYRAILSVANARASANSEDLGVPPPNIHFLIIFIPSPFPHSDEKDPEVAILLFAVRYAHTAQHDIVAQLAWKPVENRGKGNKETQNGYWTVSRAKQYARRKVYKPWQLKSNFQVLNFSKVCRQTSSWMIKHRHSGKTYILNT